MPSHVRIRLLVIAAVLDAQPGGRALRLVNTGRKLFLDRFETGRRGMEAAFARAEAGSPEGEDERMADRALYLAKASGRNRVETLPEESKTAEDALPSSP